MVDFGIKIVVDPSGAVGASRRVKRELDSIQASAIGLQRSIERSLNFSASVTSSTRALRNLRTEFARPVRLEVDGRRLTQTVRSAKAQINRFKQDGAKPIDLTVRFDKSKIASATASLKNLQEEFRKPIAFAQITTDRTTRGVQATAAALTRVRAEAAAAQRPLAGARRQLERIGASAARLKNTRIELGGIRSAVAAIGTGFAIRGVVNLGRSYENLERRVRSVSPNAAALASNLEAVSRVSEDTGTSIESNAQVFARLTIATRRLGLDGEDTAGILKTLNQTLVLGGASAQEASSAITQLGQGLASNRFQGDELRAVLEAAPLLAETLAENLGVTTGELRELGAQGELTADKLVDALQGGAGDIDARFRALGPSFDQSVTRLSNALIELGKQFGPFIDNLSSSLTFMAGLAKEAGLFFDQLNRPGGEDAASDATSRSFVDELLRNSVELQARVLSGPLGAIPGVGGRIGDFVGNQVLGEQPDFAAESAQASQADVRSTALLQVGNAIGEFGGGGLELEEIDRRASNLLKTLQDLDFTNVDIRNLANSLNGLPLEEAQQKFAGLFGETRAVAEEITNFAGAASAAADQVDPLVVAQKQLETAERQARLAIADQIFTLEQEARVIGISGVEREALIAQLEAEESVRQAGVELTTAQAEAIFGEVSALARRNALQEQANGFIESLKTKEDERNETLDQLNILYSEGILNEATYQELLANLPAAYEEATNATEGFAEAIMRANLTTAEIGAQFGQQFVGAIGRASSALADFALDGEHSIDALRNAVADILSDLAKQILQTIIQAAALRAISAAFSSGGGGGGISGIPQFLLPGGGGSAAVFDGSGPFRAQGGPVSSSAVVGERGTELFVGAGSPLMSTVSAIRSSRSISSTGVSGFRRARQSGGSVGPGSSFLVGENGPSVQQFGRSGTILQANETANLLAGQQGGGNASPVNVNATVETPVTVSLDPAEVVAMGLDAPQNQSKLVKIVADSNGAL